jgi:hypothetical protein
LARTVHELTYSLLIFSSYSKKGSRTIDSTFNLFKTLKEKKIMNSNINFNFDQLNIDYANNRDFLFDSLESETLGSSNSNVWGTPNEDAQYWRQQEGAMSCAVVAQISVYESITGEYISETAAANYAQAQGWFDPVAGTMPDDADNLLNVLGIATEQYTNATLDTIAQALYQGDKVIVGLDANEIWNPVYSTTGEPMEQQNAGHAVWVTGIEQLYDGSIGIYLNDSGTPDGQLSAVNSWDFMNAWNDMGNHMIIADA